MLTVFLRTRVNNPECDDTRNTRHALALFTCQQCAVIIVTRCSMRETRETALLHVACGNPARWRYCMGAQFRCISSLHAYSYIQQSGRT